MRVRVEAREVYWRWYGKLLLEDGRTLILPGDIAKWVREGEELRLVTRSRARVLDWDDYRLERGNGTLLWPSFSEEVEHPRQGFSGRALYRYHLRAREARFESDFEAVAELEQYHYASDHETVALWRCPDGEVKAANTRPPCESGTARLLEIRGSTPASRFLILELTERLPFEPRIVGYIRLDPPIPKMHRRLPNGEVVRDIRERVFPKDWFHPTFDLKEALQDAQNEGELEEADWRELTERVLDRVETAAARIARVVVHPDYRSDGLGALLVRLALEWARERRVPEMRREKHLVCTIAQMARFHPFFEKAGFRYLWDTASGRPVLAYALTKEAEDRLARFFAEDPVAREHQGKLYRPRYGKVAPLLGPLRLVNVVKAYGSVLDLEGLPEEVREVLLAFGVKRRRIERAVLRGVNVAFSPGSVSVLWGASGAGKTTLLRLLLGEPPDAGEVVRPEGRVAAYLPGEVEPELGGRAVLEAVYEKLGDVTAAIEVLNRVGLSDAVLWRARPRELSTGQKERFRLALLLAERPALLLVDEFAAHLDLATARRVARGLSQFVREAGITLVAATHRPGVLEALEPDQVVYVGYGSVWAEDQTSLRSTQSIRPRRRGTGIGSG